MDTHCLMNRTFWKPHFMSCAYPGKGTFINETAGYPDIMDTCHAGYVELSWVRQWVWKAGPQRRAMSPGGLGKSSTWGHKPQNKCQLWSVLLLFQPSRSQQWTVTRPYKLPTSSGSRCSSFQHHRGGATPRGLVTIQHTQYFWPTQCSLRASLEATNMFRPSEGKGRAMKALRKASCPKIYRKDRDIFRMWTVCP